MTETKATSSGFSVLYHVVYISIIMVLLMAFGMSVNRCSNNEGIYKNNLAAVQDTVRYYKSRSGTTVATKQGFTETNINKLKGYLEQLKTEIKNMKVKQSSVTAAVSTQNTVYLPVIDTVYKIEKFERGSFSRQFNFSDKFRTLEGLTRYYNDSLSVEITKNEVYFDYNVVMDKNNRIYVSSNNPYIKVNNIDGFQMVRPKQKRFGFGPFLGLGLGYDGRVTPTIGIGVVYRLF